MSGINWRGVDLNLLLTFEAMMVCRSVSAASERLHLGQPATSYNLKRLRVLLDDQLFERQGNTMVPTTRAQELAPKIDAVISIIRDDILQPVTFIPADYRDKIVIGLTDYAEQAFGPALFDSLIAELPAAKSCSRPWILPTASWRWTAVTSIWRLVYLKNSPIIYVELSFIANAIFACSITKYCRLTCLFH